MRLVLCCLVAMFAFVAPAAALDFTFSFTNDGGTVPGTVTGEIIGLTDNTAHQAAADVIIDSYPSAGLGLGPGTIDTNTPGLIHYVNSFDVTSGQVTAANFYVYDPTASFQIALDFANPGGHTFLTNDGGTLDVFGGIGLAVDNIRPIGTPEPSSLILCGLGAVGLLLAARRRRKRQDAIAAS